MIWSDGEAGTFTSEDLVHRYVALYGTPTEFEYRRVAAPEVQP